MKLATELYEEAKKDDTCRFCGSHDNLIYEGFGRMICAPCIIKKLQNGTLRLYQPAKRQRWVPGFRSFETYKTTEIFPKLVKQEGLIDKDKNEKKNSCGNVPLYLFKTRKERINLRTAKQRKSRLIKGGNVKISVKND